MKIENYFDKETFIDNFYFFIQYIRENFIGLLIFLSVFIIIYFVDYINYYNTLFILSQPTYNIGFGIVPTITYPKRKKKTP